MSVTELMRAYVCSELFDALAHSVSEDTERRWQQRLAQMAESIMGIRIETTDDLLVERRAKNPTEPQSATASLERACALLVLVRSIPILPAELAQRVRQAAADNAEALMRQWGQDEGEA